MKENSLSTHGMIRDISSMSKIAVKLMDRGKEYEDLLTFILKEDYYYNDNVNIPSVKELIKLTGIPYSKLKRQLELIYQDLRNQEDPELLFDIRETEYMFSLKYWERSILFFAKSIPVMPRVGEQIVIPFYKEFVGTEHFFVKKIEHTLTDRKQVIYIKLEHGDYNLFWHFRLDEALEKHEIHWRDVWDKESYELKRILQVTPNWAY